jgi:hypothetical protein
MWSLTGDHVPVGVALDAANVRQRRNALEHAELACGAKPVDWRMA